MGQGKEYSRLGAGACERSGFESSECSERSISERSKREYRNCKRYRKVYKYDLSGNIVAEYADLDAASVAERVHPYTLLRRLTGRIRVSNDGFIFKWNV